MIIGASFDTVEDQAAFAESQDFPYTLLADSTKAVGEAYGAQRTPEMKYYEAGIPRRISYLISPEGKIAKAYDLDASGEDLTEHAQTILNDLAALA